METNTMPDDRYTLATGEIGTRRLQILHEIHKPYTEFLLQRVGLKSGMFVADMGCGIGTVSHWLAEQVGFNGLVFGVDRSAEQLKQARKNADALKLSNITFVEGSAYDLELPCNSFDLVYSRFLLMHLTRPLDALREMLLLLKPGGLLVCEEADFGSAFCDPPSPAHDRCFELFLALSDVRSQHFCIGASLYRIFKEVGLAQPQLSLIQPVIARGRTKRLIEFSLLEASEALIEAGLAERWEIEQIAAQLSAIAADEKVLLGIPRVTQIWARKSPSSKSYTGKHL
jgi:SAM-dependent methyltransferase